MLAKCPCNHCSTHLEFDVSQKGETVPCPTCGLDTVLFIPGVSHEPPVIPAIPPVQPQTESEPPNPDQAILNENGIVVTPTRFMSGHNMFPIAAIGSIRTGCVEPDNSGVIWLGFFACGFLTASFWSLALSFEAASDRLLTLALFGIFLVVGIFLLIIALMTRKRLKPIFVLWVTTTAREQQAFSSINGAAVQRVEAALHQAIAMRR